MHFRSNAVVFLWIVACGSGPAGPASVAPRTEPVATETPVSDREALPGSPANAEASASTEAPAPEDAASIAPGLSRLPTEGLRQARLMGVSVANGAPHGLFLERGAAERSDVLTSRSLADLGAVSARWPVRIAGHLVLAAWLTDDGAVTAHRSQSSGDTAVSMRALGDAGAESVAVVPAFGDPELERGDTLRAFDLVTTDPPRGIAAWRGISRRPRPAAEMAAARRRFEEDRRRFPNQIVNPPDTHRTVASWRRFGVAGPRGVVTHELSRRRANRPADESTKTIQGVVAGEARHAGIFGEERADRRGGLGVWFFDARSGRRTGRYSEMDGDPHGFSFRTGRFDAEGRLWLVGAASVASGGDHHWVYVLDARARLVSRRELPHRATWNGTSGLLECGGAMWAVTAAVDQPERRERLFVYRLAPEGDVGEPRVVFEADSPYGPGDSVWHTHDLQLACNGDEVVAAFRFAPRHAPRPETPVGFVRWAVEGAAQ